MWVFRAARESLAAQTGMPCGPALQQSRSVNAIRSEMLRRDHIFLRLFFYKNTEQPCRRVDSKTPESWEGRCQSCATSNGPARAAGAESGAAP